MAGTPVGYKPRRYTALLNLSVASDFMSDDSCTAAQLAGDARNSGDATHDSSLPVPARQTGRSSLKEGPCFSNESSLCMVAVRL